MMEFQDYYAALGVAPDADELASLVYVPLRGDAGPLGILALGSPDARRFTPDMGTLYLVRLGELLSAALQRHLEA